MKENNNPIKVKLTTAIILIAIAVIVIIGIIAIILNNSKDNTYGKDKMSQNGSNYTDNNFDFEFLKMENKGENMIYSPLSIKYALKMLQEGSASNTYNQINNVIGSLNLPTYKSIDKSLSLANGLFIKNTYNEYVKQTYKDTLTNKYNAEIIEDEFKNATKVNEWISNKTLGIIKDMLKDEAFKNQTPDSELAMLLVNALAIDMEWNGQFDANYTREDTFFLEDGTEMQATMMKKETHSDDVSYYIDNDVTAVTMDLKEYDGEKLEFMAIMPESDLNEYINSITMNEVNEISNNLKLASKEKYGVNIKIPKFSYDYDLNLKEDLQKLGITDAFDEEMADFSNMAEINKTNNNLYVSDALHKANIDFTEKGVKAATATVFAIQDTSALRVKNNPVEVNINKPFLFLIRDKSTKEVWFVGTVYEPNSWENDKADYEHR